MLNQTCLFIFFFKYLFFMLNRRSRTLNLQKSTSDSQRNLRGVEVGDIHADPPLPDLLPSVMHRLRDVRHEQRRRYEPQPGTGSQTPLEPVCTRPPWVPWLQDRRQANIWIANLAELPPFFQRVPRGVLVLTARFLRFGRLTHNSKKKST